MQEEREKQAQLRGAPAIDPDHAATKIQKVWKGYAQRKRTKKLREEEFEFIGMVRTKCFVKCVNPLMYNSCSRLVMQDMKVEESLCKKTAACQHLSTVDFFAIERDIQNVLTF